jgi:hypothetical protein
VRGIRRTSEVFETSEVYYKRNCIRREVLITNLTCFSENRAVPDSRIYDNRSARTGYLRFIFQDDFQDLLYHFTGICTFIIGEDDDSD